MAATIDRHLGARWEAERVRPAAPAADGDFLRRAYLDLTGSIPLTGDARQFLEDTGPDKRERLVEQLVESAAFTSHYADTWIALLVPEAEGDFQVANVSQELRAWLRRRLMEGARYDELVREVLTVSLGTNRGQGAYAYYSNSMQPRPTAFYAAKDTRPENLAAATARVFLGVRVDCAQCHDHPFAHWKRDEFWGYAALFQGLQRRTNNPFAGLLDLFEGKGAQGITIQIPETDRYVPARFLDGGAPRADQAPRDAVAEWLTSRDNPYFARAAVNRAWGSLLGVGLVEPIDDMASANAPSHPELLDELARQFSEDFDLRGLHQGIMLSRAYQLSSRADGPGQERVELFARFVSRGLEERQIRASLGQVIGGDASFQDEVGFNVNLDDISRVVRVSAPPTERATSVQDALRMMNGDLAQAATDPGRCATLAAALELPMTDGERIDTLFLATLSRVPDEVELRRCLDHWERCRAREGANPQDVDRQALADILWSLLNRTEFVVMR